MGRVTPYSPLGEKPKEVSEETMRAILKKHAQPKVEVQVSKAGETPKAERLKWLKPEDPRSCLIHTACGRYRCRKTAYTGKWVYHLEKLVEGLWFYEMGKSVPTFAEAQSRAQADADLKP